MNSTTKNTYILRFWSCEACMCGHRGGLCVSGGGERDQTPLDPHPIENHFDTCNTTFRAPHTLIFGMVVCFGDIKHHKKFQGMGVSGWWDIGRGEFLCVRCICERARPRSTPHHQPSLNTPNPDHISSTRRPMITKFFWGVYVTNIHYYAKNQYLRVSTSIITGVDVSAAGGGDNRGLLSLSSTRYTQITTTPTFTRIGWPKTQNICIFGCRIQW